MDFSISPTPTKGILMWWILETVAAIIVVILSLITMAVVSYIHGDLTPLRQGFLVIFSAIVYGLIAFEICRWIRKKYNRPEGLH